MIYFIRNITTGAIKIGFSESSPESRLRSIRTASADPVELVSAIGGNRADEADLHRRFKAHRLCGEWFRPDPGFLTAIDALIDAGLHKTVWFECERRGGCRSGLNGLAVRRLDTGEVQDVRSSFWDKDSRLVLILVDRSRHDAEQCELAEEWPVVCCSPSRLTA